MSPLADLVFLCDTELAKPVPPYEYKPASINGFKFKEGASSLEGLRFEVGLLFKVIEIGGLKEAGGVSKHCA